MPPHALLAELLRERGLRVTAAHRAERQPGPLRERVGDDHLHLVCRRCG